MANAYEPYHVPQQSRRDKLRFSSSAIFPLVDVDFLSASTEPHSPGNFMGFLGGVSVTGSLSSSSAVVHGGGDRACNQTFNGVGLGGDVFVFKPEPLSLSLSSHHNYYTLHRSGYDIGVPGAGGSVASRGSVPLGPLGPFTGYASILKGSRFLKPAQQLLEEFCNVGRGIYSDIIDDGDDSSPSLESTVENITSSSGGGESSKKKSTLISMLDEVYKRYKQYNEQIQSVIESFECVAGLGNATPFVSMALKALSKHFKCLKNTIIDQLHFTNKTQQQGQPQGYFDHHPPVWKPHRGLPERAVIVLRAWLFDHFLHPYPTDTDKLMLAKQTGLSRNQVSNWFINARVRLWKPMVEEIHLLETRKLHKSALRSTTTVISDNVLPENPHYSLLSKRTRNDVVPSAGGSSGNDVLGFSYGGQNVPVLSTNGVSLTLGLHHQNNGIGLTEPFPVTASQRFELGGGEGYAGGGGGLEGQNRQFGRNFSGGSSSNQLLNEFIG